MSLALIRPTRNAATVTPHDTNDIAPTNALYVGTAGTLKVDLLGGTTFTITNAQVGYHPLMVTRVYNTGTAAADIHALY